MPVKIGEIRADHRIAARDQQVQAARLHPVGQRSFHGLRPALPGTLAMLFGLAPQIAMGATQIAPPCQLQRGGNRPAGLRGLAAEVRGPRQR